MANIFPRSSNWLPLKIVIILGFLSTGVFAGMWYYFTPKYTRVGYQPAQPVPFPHNVHVDQLGMDCRYCHSFVEVAAESNIPTTQVCMNCHSQVQKDNPKLKPVFDSWQTGKPVEWVQIHKNPDYVYFNHSVHVNRGVSCVSCHGRIDQMETVYHAKSLTMKFCLDCHRKPEDFLRPLDKITKLGWQPTPQGGRASRMRKPGSARPSRRRNKSIRRTKTVSVATANFRSQMSKRVFQHPPEQVNGRKYWRSLGQLSDSPEFRQQLEREYPRGAAEFEGGEVSRRNFVQLMGASAALAGLSLASCRRPEKHLVPFTKGVEWSIPGKALFYATSRPTRRGSIPLVAATYDGRPTKIEGNPLHPAVEGASDIWSQSSILDLYDPDRSQHFLYNDNPSTEAAFEKALAAIVQEAGDGSGLAFLTEGVTTPTRERLRGEISKKFPKASWFAHDATAGDHRAAALAFGDGYSVVPDIAKADVILALDADFLSSTEGDTETIRQFSARRKADGAEFKMNRLYVVENRYTVTGGIADHRLRVPASQIGAFLAVLAGHIAKATGDAALAETLKGLQANAADFNPDWVRESAADLVSAKGRGLVLVGERQPASVQLLGYAVNAALGNLNKTLLGRRAYAHASGTFVELAAAASAKKIKTLFVLGGNPAFTLPSDLSWKTVRHQIPTVVRLGLHEDETSQRANWHVPAAHYLESWDDGRASDGSYTSVQPMILPLYGGWSEVDVLCKVAGLAKPEGPEQVQVTFNQIAGAGDFGAAWAKFLRDGFLAGSEAKPDALKFNSAAAGKFIAEHSPISALAAGTFEVVLVPDSKLGDGRHANNGWLQEIPDPISKLTWDNAALISPESAKQLGLDMDPVQIPSDSTFPVVEVEVDGRKIEIPLLTVPGHADKSITIALGYGREVSGRVGTGRGVNAFPLAISSQPYFLVGAKVTLTDRRYELGITQEHGAMEGRGSDITREATFEKYKEVASATANSEDAAYFKKLGMDAHIPKNVSLYTHPPLSDPYQWGMTVDMSACTGCSACMIACQAENNIPIVGKEQVIGNREMHWIRADRYFATDEGNMTDPEMISQPMLCQHCENAPCETVCPVNATVHSEDGINVMAYNRCIGTRYCANNCPFKVRRFNFFDYNMRDVLGRKEGEIFSGVYKWNLVTPKEMPETIKMQKNPNVTVRMRGVMEKCTFCIQRVQEAKITAKVHARDTADVKIPTDSFTTACAQVCPTEAITFGNIADPEAKVSKLRAKERGYRLLEYLNLSTRVMYLARIRNPNPKMPDAAKLGNFIKSHHGGKQHEEAAAAGGHA